MDGDNIFSLLVVIAFFLFVLAIVLGIPYMIMSIVLNILGSGLTPAGIIIGLLILILIFK